VVTSAWIRRAGLAAVVAVVLYGAWGWLFTSDEARVRAAIDALADTLSSDASDPLGQVAAIGALRRQLAADVVVQSGRGAEVRGRDAVAAFWQRLRTSSGGMRVRILDVEVTVAGDGRNADCSGVAEVTRTPNGVPERELHEMRATFVAEDGEWRLATAAAIDAVSPP
jgi:ketosteroid isomerase-like protein